MPFDGSELEHVLCSRSRINYSDQQRLFDLDTGLVNYVGSAVGLVVVYDRTEEIPWWIIKTRHQKSVMATAIGRYGMKVGLVDIVGRDYARRKRLQRWRDDRLQKKYGKSEELSCHASVNQQLTYHKSQAT